MCKQGHSPVGFESGWSATQQLLPQNQPGRRQQRIVVGGWRDRRTNVALGVGCEGKAVWRRFTPNLVLVNP